MYRFFCLLLVFMVSTLGASCKLEPLISSLNTPTTLEKQMNLLGQLALRGRASELCLLDAVEKLAVSADLPHASSIKKRLSRYNLAAIELMHQTKQEGKLLLLARIAAICHIKVALIDPDGLFAVILADDIIKMASSGRGQDYAKAQDELAQHVLMRHKAQYPQA